MRDGRGAQIREFIESSFENAPAASFFLSFVWACDTIDDLVDGDEQRSPGDVMKLARICLYEIPSNPFYQSFAAELRPLIWQAIAAWEGATKIELFAKWDGNPEARLLRNSYEMRNSCFDLALYIMELLHGYEARTNFAVKWYELSRNYEDFEDYVVKVTAENRPAKGG